MSMSSLLFWRAILTLDATALRFGSQFDLLSALREFFKAARPTPIERFLSLTTNRALALDLLRVEREAPLRVETLIGDVSQRRYQQVILQTTMPSGQRLDGSD